MMIKRNILFLFFIISASLQGAALYKQNIATKATHIVQAITAQETKIRAEACARLNEIAQKSTNATFKTDVQKLLQLATTAHPLPQIKQILQQYAFLANMQGSTPLNALYKQEYKDLLLFAAAFTPTVAKNYTVNPQVEIVQQKIADYTTFVGNELQHTLHKEVVTTLDEAVKVAQLPQENALKQATIAAQCANTAHTLNIAGNVQQGFSWVSLGKTILHCSVAAIKGGSQAIIQPLGQIILHPLDTALRTWHTAQSLYKAVSDPQQTLIHLQEYAHQTYDFIAQGGLQRAGNNFLEYLYNQPETAVEKATYYAVQFFVVPKILTPLKNAVSLPNLAHAVTHKFVPKASKVKTLKQASDAITTENAKVLKVAHMKQFFKESELGQLLAPVSTKTHHRYQGQSIYKLKKEINHSLQKGDMFYLDALHKDHIEVFDHSKRLRCVLNLNGTENISKTIKAQNRTLDM